MPGSTRPPTTSTSCCSSCTPPPPSPCEPDRSAPGSTAPATTARSCSPSCPARPSPSCSDRGLRVGVQGGQVGVDAGAVQGVVGGRRAAGDVAVEEGDGDLVDRVQVLAAFEERGQVAAAEQGEHVPGRRRPPVDLGPAL